MKEFGAPARLLLNPASELSKMVAETGEKNSQMLKQKAMGK